MIAAKPYRAKVEKILASNLYQQLPYKTIEMVAPI